MKINITPTAASLFKSEEWGFQNGDNVRVFVRYSDGGEEGTFGITKDFPASPALSYMDEQIHYYMEQDDVWHLDGKDLTIDCMDDSIVFQRY